MLNINIPNTETLCYDERADLLWKVLTTLYEDVEMERVDGGYSITIEIEEDLYGNKKQTQI